MPFAVSVRSDQLVLQRVMCCLRLHLRAGLGLSDQTHVRQGVHDPRVVEAVHPHPVDARLELVHPVVHVKHVVQDAAREEHVVDDLFHAVEEGGLEGPEVALQDVQEAFDVLADALQLLAVPGIFRSRRVLAGLLKYPSL